MPLTLASPEIDRLARSLAALTGETVEQAVERAVRDQLAREHERQQRPGGEHDNGNDVRLLDDVQAIARRFQEQVGRPFTSLDHGELLYDEAGLPR